MTRSNKALSRREQFNKTVRATAHSEGLIFRDARAKLTGETNDKKHEPLPQESRRNDGRNGTTWNGGTFINNVDDGVEDINTYQAVEFVEPRHETNITVSLLDIARPAKKRGIAKDFEVLSKPTSKHVIVLDEDDYLDDDAWEAIFAEPSAPTSRTPYASIVSGGFR